MKVIVVGGGIAGCTVALALRRRGSEAVLVDVPGLDGAATPASAGMVAPLYETDPAEPTFGLGVESRARYPGFLASVNELAGGDVALEDGGMLVANLCSAEDGEAAMLAESLRAKGHTAEILAAAEAARLEPSVARDARSFLWLPNAVRVDCRRLLDALRQACLASGVDAVDGRAAGVLARGERARGVRLEDGRTAEGDGVVVAAGCWSGRLDGLPGRIPVRPIRGQMLRLEAENLPGGPLLADHAGRYLVPRPGGALAGSTMEEAGYAADVTASGEAAIREAVGRLCPAAAAAPVTESWAGLRPVSEDGRPVVGPDPRLQGLHYATGYGRAGILLAPLLADAVADLALGSEPEIAWEALSIDRFRR